MARIGSDDDVMYVYTAELFCNSCGSAIKQGLDLENPPKEDTGDSNDYPQTALISQSETDTPNHCGDCGGYLAQPLTDNGIEYAIQCIRQYVTTPAHPGNGTVLDEWAEDLGNYWLGTEEKTVIDIYNELRQNEADAANKGE